MHIIQGGQSSSEDHMENSHSDGPACESMPASDLQVAEIKRLTTAVSAARGEVAKLEEAVEECCGYRAFLDAVTPPEWTADMVKERAAVHAMKLTTCVPDLQSGMYLGQTRAAAHVPDHIKQVMSAMDLLQRACQSSPTARPKCASALEQHLT